MVEDEGGDLEVEKDGKSLVICERAFFGLARESKAGALL